MAGESEAAVHKITELRVVDLKVELKKRNLNTSGNKSALIERLRQTEEEERGNADEISITPEVPGNETPERMETGHVVEDEETEACREKDFGERQETDVLSEEADVVEEKKNVAESLGEAHSSVPPETPPEDLQLFSQYMIITDSYQVEDNSLVELQVEDMLTLDVNNGVHLDAPKTDSTQLVKEKMDIEKTFVTGKSSEMENNQQERDVQGASIESTEKEPQPGTEQRNGETMKPEDEGSGKAAKNQPSIVEGSEQNKSSVEDGKNTNNEASPKKGLPGNHSTSDTEGKKLSVSGLCSTTKVTCLKNVFSKYDKAKSEPGHKRCTEEKRGNVTDSKSSCRPKSESDRGQSGARSSVDGKSNDRNSSRGDSRKQENDGKDRRRGKDEHRYRSSHSSKGD